jgi:uncharacterized protein
MSPAPADLVNAAELAGRAARLERRLALSQLPRVGQAGGLESSSVTAQLDFGRFEGHVSVTLLVRGVVVLTCQRCMKPCACELDESATLVIVERDTDEVPGGYEPLLGDAERLSLTGVIEDQVLLGLPLVPMHASAAQCGAAAATLVVEEPETAAEEKQRPFANLRQLLDEGTG